MPTTLGLSLALLVVSPAAMAKQHPPVHHHKAPNFKAKAVSLAGATCARKAAVTRRTGAKRDKVAQRSRGAVRRTASLPAADQYIGPVQITGRGQVGRAAWYGNQHVGRLTSSGERLDTVEATAAHRSLPLHSLVRVTNLQNGRAVIVRINDRGPVSPSLLIDMSPRAAAAIDMINQGIAQVMVEPVAPAVGVGSSSER